MGGTGENAVLKEHDFNHCSQLDGESVQHYMYITTLYALAENCDHKNCKDEMIRDQLVVLFYQNVCRCTQTKR